LFFIHELLMLNYQYKLHVCISFKMEFPPSIFSRNKNSIDPLSNRCLILKCNYSTITVMDSNMTIQVHPGFISFLEVRCYCIEI
jgi:hypothetical protein